MNPISCKIVEGSHNAVDLEDPVEEFEIYIK
jgi:hypothetical protein